MCKKGAAPAVHTVKRSTAAALKQAAAADDHDVLFATSPRPSSQATAAAKRPSQEEQGQARSRLAFLLQAAAATDAAVAMPGRVLK